MSASEQKKQAKELKLIFQKGPYRGKTFPLAGERITIGRNSTNDIVIESITVSSFHAVLIRHPSGSSWCIEDLRSKNGTLVNGEPIKKSNIKDGDTITFSRDDFKAVIISEKDEPSEPEFLQTTLMTTAAMSRSAVKKTPFYKRTAVYLVLSLLVAGTGAGLFFASKDRGANPSNMSAPGSIDIELKATVDPIYSSLFLSYRDSPIGEAHVINRGEAALSDLKLAFSFMKEAESFTVIPFLAEVPEVAPGGELKIPILPKLSTDILSPETREVTAVVKVLQGKTVVSEEKLAVFIHGRNVFNWEKPERISAFIHPQDPALTEFVNSVWRERPESTPKAFPPKAVQDAVSLFTGLSELGLRYLPDAKTPISAKIDSKANDRVNYPIETLINRTGDCDDLSVLCAAMLEAANIPAAIVVGPRHVLIMFDTSLHADALNATPFDPTTVLIWKDRIWMPIETTVFGRKKADFSTAWAEGWVHREAIQLKEMTVVEVRDGWKQYPPMKPPQDAETLMKITGISWSEKHLSQKIEHVLLELKKLFDQNLKGRIREIELQVPPGSGRDRTIGLLYAQSGLFDRAQVSFKKALFGEKEIGAGALSSELEKLPETPETPYLLSDLAISLTMGASCPDDFTNAASCYRHAIDLLPESMPDRSEFLLRLALVHRLRGDLAAEKKWTRQAFAAAPFLRETYDEMVKGEGSRAGENDALKRFLLKGLK